MLVSEKVQEAEYEPESESEFSDGKKDDSHITVNPVDIPWYRRFFGDSESQLHKSLETRMLILTAMGGTIGTGIFFSTGATVAVAGPGGALVIYGITALFVISVVVCLSEMASYIPATGAFQHYGTRFFDDSLGMALGVMYAASWILSIPSEVSSMLFIIDYWVQESGMSIHTWVWCFLVFPIFLIQLFNVRVYGEVEYWLAWIKVFFLIMFIIVGLLYNWGGVPTASVPSPGLSNFKHGAAFAGGFGGLFSEGYAFYTMGGTESVAIAAGEAKLPWRAVPQASRGSIWRIIMFCVMTVLIIGLNINYKDTRLVNAMDTNDPTISPITIVFEMAGFGQARNVINAVLLVAILSSVNSCFYIASRMLAALARDGQFFKPFGWTTKSGVPLVSELFVLAVSCLTFLTTIWGNGVVFSWFTNLTSASSVVVWGAIGLISYRFRGALKAQGVPLSDLPMTQYLFPVMPILCVVIGGFLIAGMGYSSCQGTYGVDWDWKDPFATFLSIGVFCLCYIGWKITHWKTDSIKKYEEIDLSTNRVWGVGEGKHYMRDFENDLFTNFYTHRRDGFKSRIEWWWYIFNNPFEVRRHIARHLRKQD